MAEPKNRNSVEWRDWYIRNNVVGSAAVAALNTKTVEDLEIFKQFLDDLIQEKKGKEEK